VGTVLAIPVTATQVGRPRLAPICAIAFALSGAMMCLVGLVPVDAVALTAICAWGLAMAASDSTSMALLHRALDPRGLFQTVGAMDALKLISEGVGTLIAPALEAMFGMRIALVICGLPMPVLVILAASRLRATDQRASDRGRLVGLLHRVTLFAGLDLASIEDLASRLHPVLTAAGENLVTQGEPGDHFYVIESGRASVLVDGYPTGYLDAGRWLGERALLRSSARSATVRAEEALLTQALGREDFLQAVTGLRLASDTAFNPVLDDGIEKMPTEELLGMLTPLSALDGARLKRLAEHARRESFEAGVPVFAEGDESDAMYVVLAGRAVATAANGALAETLHPGDVFGEIGILHGIARTRTVTAADSLTVLRIPADELPRAPGRIHGRWHPHTDLLGRPEAEPS
jgi:CRP-like cAMP-binding protein